MSCLQRAETGYGDIKPAPWHVTWLWKHAIYLKLVCVDCQESANGSIRIYNFKSYRVNTSKFYLEYRAIACYHETKEAN